MTESKQAKKLTKAQEVFIDEYLVCLNATEAYSRAYPKAKRESAGAAGHRLLRNVEISAEIDRRQAEYHMTINEALRLQADIGRGDMGALADENGFFDFKRAKRMGLTRLVKKFDQEVTTILAKKEDGEDREIIRTKVELYPADIAQERILKIHGKFKDSVDITSGGQPLTPKMSDEERMENMKKLASAIVKEMSKK
jgi:phage terminase small subunit